VVLPGSCLFFILPYYFGAGVCFTFVWIVPVFAPIFEGKKFAVHCFVNASSTLSKILLIKEL
jgi:hypothetical protein